MQNVFAVVVLGLMQSLHAVLIPHATLAQSVLPVGQNAPLSNSTTSVNLTSAASVVTLPDRTTAIKSALDWLLDYCLSAPKLRRGSANAAAQFQIVQCQTALLLALHPELFPEDARRVEVLATAEKIGRSQYVGSFTTWLSGFAALYLAEQSTRSEQPRVGLGSIAEFWLSSQNLEGGWGHSGQRMMGDLYPSTLISSSNFGLLALGAAKHFGHPTSNWADFADALDEALEMYRAVQSQQGGLPYGARSYCKAPQAGRTAASLIGLAALNQTDDELFTKGVCYVTKNVHTVPYGHASPAMHAVTGSLAFAMLGGEPWREFQSIHFPELLRCQQPDGTFNDFADGPDSLPIMSSPRGGKAYRTASYAIALSAGESKWMKRLGRTFALAKVLDEGKRSIATIQAKTQTPKSSTDVAPYPAIGVPLVKWARPNVTHRATDIRPSTPADAQRIAIIRDRQNFELLNFIDGRIQSKWKFERPLKRQDRIRLLGDRVFVLRSASLDADDDLFASNASVLRDAGLQKPVINIQCYRVGDGQQLWASVVPRFIKELWLDQRAHFIGFSGGEKFSMNLNNGSQGSIQNFPAFGGNAAISSSPMGDVFLSTLASIKLRDEKEIWSTRFRGQRGTTQPAAQSSVFHAGNLLVTRTDGSVICLDGETGEQIWKHRDSRITEVAAIVGLPDRVFLVGTSDGIVTAIPTATGSKQRPLWQAATFVGREIRKGSESVSTGITARVVNNDLVIWNKLSSSAVVLNGTTGEPMYKIQDAGELLVSADYIVASGPTELRVYSVK